MAKYLVTFTQYHQYEIEADSQDAACNIGYNVFAADMKIPVANTLYDEVEAELISGDED